MIERRGLVSLRPAEPRWSPPRVVALFFVVDVLLVLLYGLNAMVGKSTGLATQLLNLNWEANIPSWYSWTQLGIIGLMLAAFACAQTEGRSRQSVALMLAAAAFFFLSLDEAASIHERLGTRIDQWLHTGHDGAGAFKQTGVWMFVFGPPLLAAFLWMAWQARALLGASRRATILYGIGLAVFLGSATGTELAYNFVTGNGAAAVVQAMAEELGEMLGATFLLWGTWEMLAAHSFSLDFTPRPV